jgi:hypothetical protein
LTKRYDGSSSYLNTNITMAFSQFFVKEIAKLNMATTLRQMLELHTAPCISPTCMTSLELTYCMGLPYASPTCSYGPHLRFVPPFFGILESAGHRFSLHVFSLVSRVSAPHRPHSMAVCKTALRQQRLIKRYQSHRMFGEAPFGYVKATSVCGLTYGPLHS